MDDDRLPATRGELRRLAAKVERLEELRPKVSELREEFRHMGVAVQGHIESAMASALKPYDARFARLDNVADAVERSEAILREQEVRAKLTAERRAEEEVARAERAAAREHSIKRWSVLGPIIIAVVGALGAMVGSQIKNAPPSAPITHEK